MKFQIQFECCCISQSIFTMLLQNSVTNHYLIIQYKNPENISKSIDPPFGISSLNHPKEFYNHGLTRSYRASPRLVQRNLNIIIVRINNRRPHSSSSGIPKTSSKNFNCNQKWLTNLNFHEIE